MQVLQEITDSERNAVERHLSSTDSKLSPKVIDKMLFKYEITLQNKLTEIINLKMDLDDRDIAVDLFFRRKLKATDIKNLINNGN